MFLLESKGGTCLSRSRRFQSGKDDPRRSQARRLRQIRRRSFGLSLKPILDVSSRRPQRAPPPGPNASHSVRTPGEQAPSSNQGKTAKLPMSVRPRSNRLPDRPDGRQSTSGVVSELFRTLRSHWDFHAFQCERRLRSFFAPRKGHPVHAFSSPATHASKEATGLRPEVTPALHLALKLGAAPEDGDLGTGLRDVFRRMTRGRLVRMDERGVAENRCLFLGTCFSLCLSLSLSLCLCLCHCLCLSLSLFFLTYCFVF